MRLISFDALRTLHFPPHRYIKPEQFTAHRGELAEADWLLYPQYWQINTLLYGGHARIFPSPASYYLGHDKVEMTRLLQWLAPDHHPETVIRGNTPENAAALWAQFDPPFVAKLPRSSMGEGVFLIDSHREWLDYCERSPVLYVQEYLPVDRDLRLVVIGDRVVGGYWRLQSPDGFHNNVARGGTVLPGPLPEAAVQLVESLARSTGIDHAGFDVMMLGERPYVLEFNRLFGTRGLQEHQGDLTAHILHYLQRRLDELRPQPPRPRTSAASSRRRRLRRAA